MCKTYVGGRQCERCDDNYYNTSHGCRGKVDFVPISLQGKTDKWKGRSQGFHIVKKMVGGNSKVAGALKI